MGDSPLVHVGVLQIVLHIPGARTLKDGRQVLHSLRDRIRHRFEISVHEVDPGDTATRRVLVCTTAGNDAKLIRSTLDKVRALVDSSGHAIAVDARIDVFGWHAPEPDWMRAVGGPPEGEE